MNDPRIEELKEQLKKAQDLIYEMESTTVDGSGRKYPVRGHPRWDGQQGNPYLPLNDDGTMRKGYVG